MTAPYPLEDNLGYLLNRCANEMAARFARELAAHDVTLAQWGVMIAVNAGRGRTPTEVARAVGIDKGATTRLIARMEDKGLLTRKGNSSDGRSVHLELSAHAKALMPELTKLSRAVNDDVLAMLEPDKGAALKQILSDLLNQMSAGGR